MPHILRSENNSSSRKGLYWLIPVLLIVALLYSMSTRSQSSNSSSTTLDNAAYLTNPATNGAIVSGTGTVNLRNSTGTSGAGSVSGTSY